jgi:carboxymethylenebutenolidase
MGFWLTLNQIRRMKKGVLLILLSFYWMAPQAQTKSCCPPTRQFAMLAMNAGFVQAHMAPPAFRYRDTLGKMIRFSTPDGSTAGAYMIASPRPSRDYLMVFQEWWGVNGYIKQMCATLQHDLGNVNVIAPDLYDGKVAATPQQAGAYMQQVTDARARAIIRGVLAYCGNKARVYTIGWCFGGGWSLQASLMAGTCAAGCVMYYGMPEKNVDTLKKLHCDVLGLFAGRDGWITPQVVDTFAAAMKAAKKKLTVCRYDAVHAFANPSNPKHDEADTRNAYAHTLAFLKARLK